MITIGDHIRKQRLDLRLTQREVAARLGVDETSVWNWESNTSRPFWRYWGLICEFLGYDPFPPARTHGERLVRHRQLLGLSQKEAARWLLVDPSTLGRWERGERQPTRRFVDKIERLLARTSRSCLHGELEPTGHSPLH